MAVDSTEGVLSMTTSPAASIYFHTPEGIDDNDQSLDWDNVMPDEAHISLTTFSTRLYTPPSDGPPLVRLTPKQKQVEADFWQARSGHYSDWQLKVLPLLVTGTPTKFAPHPFASYDVYNQA